MDSAIEFQRLCAQDRDDDTLCLPTWSVEDWQALFAHCTTVQVASGSIVIQRGDRERALYFVDSGALVARERWASSTESARVRCSAKSRSSMAIRAA